MAKLNTGSDLIDLAKPGGHAAPTCNLYQPLLSPPQLSGHHHNNLYTTENHNGTTAEEKPWIDTAEVVDKLMQEYSLKFQENYPSSNICNSYPNWNGGSHKLYSKSTLFKFGTYLADLMESI